jgi:DHA1 family arabinose polymer transporter-like MFS transporter
VVATRLAKPGKQAQSIAMMFTGLTLANLAMVPFVTWLGHQLSWRYAFGVVSVLGLLTLISLNSFCLIWTAVQQHSETSWSFQICKAWHIIAITGIGFGGLFAWFSYITPLMTNVSRFETDFIAYIMVLAGAGMVVRNFLGGIMADKMRPALAGNFA